MEIKELIKDIRAIYTCSLKEADKRGYDIKKYAQKFNKVESSILELEKYRLMFKKLEEITGAIEWEMVDLKEMKRSYFG